MNKEIGSIFPLRERVEWGDSGLSRFFEHSKGRIRFFFLCREALYALLGSLNVEDGKKRACLPAYTCRTVIDPFEQLGWECRFYAVDRSLKIDSAPFAAMIDDFRPSVVLAHPYYGADYREDELEILNRAKRAGAILVKDVTHCLFSPWDDDIFDYRVGSIRKWLGIPDGGFLEGLGDAPESPRGENESFVGLQSDAMLLRGMYFEYGDQCLKDVSRRLNKQAERLAEGQIVPHELSLLSSRLLGGVDPNRVMGRRMENCKTLHKGVSACCKVRPVFADLERMTSAPLYYPVYMEDRERTIASLASKGIYVPILWRKGSAGVVINDTVESIYESIAAIPCDQRYGAEDMKRIVDELKRLEEGL